MMIEIRCANSPQRNGCPEHNPVNAL
jgi:hypothetical protein